jgi:CRISPR type III-B/RAMP module RAMP protein Cmr1
MPSLRLTVETLTPLLMYGADQNVPELRGSSFRGILRYWLRAVLGAKKEYRDSSELYKAESNILGSTERGSKITLKIQQPERMKSSPRQWVLPKQTSKGWKPRYDAFPPDSTFWITLSAHPLDASNVLAEDSPLVKALFLMAHIGGLGKRSRRGSGNLRVRDVKGYDNEDMPLAVLTQNRTELGDYLRLMSDFINESNEIGHRPNFATFAPDTCVILLGKETYPTLEDVLGNRGDLWSVSGPYHHAGGIFGEATKTRRASAIHMRVAVTQEGYVPQQTIFYSGHGAWDKMKDYIAACTSSGFELIYGDSKGW